MRQFAEFWQPFLICSPTASKLKIEDLQREIEYDRFALSKWSPTASEIVRDEFLGISFSHHMEILHKTKDIKTRQAIKAMAGTPRPEPRPLMVTISIGARSAI